VRSHPVEISAEHADHFFTREGRALLGHSAVERLVQNEQLGRVDCRRVDEVCDVMTDHRRPERGIALVRRRHGDGARTLRKGTHTVVPPRDLATRQPNHDVEVGVEVAKLIDPGFVAVQNKQSQAAESVIWAVSSCAIESRAVS